MRRISRPRIVGLAASLLLALVIGRHAALADDSAAAFRVPPVNGLSGLYWLTAADFTPSELVSVTLTAPDGETCPALDIKSGASVFAASAFGGVQTTVAPGRCVPLEGQWTATFAGAGGHTVSTTFAFAPNQIVAGP